jgi:hypothetical protein
MLFNPLYIFKKELKKCSHIHSLLWLKDEENEDAPNFWSEPDPDQNDQSKKDQDKTIISEKNKQDRIKKKLNNLQIP